MSSNSSTLSAVAASIQERVNTLNSERHSLQQLQEQLETEKSLLENEKKRMKSVRKKYLALVQERNEVELQLLEMGQHCDALTSEIEHLTVNQIPAFQAKIESIHQLQMTSDIELYTTHLTNILLNQRQMEEKLYHYNKKKVKRETLLKQLALKTNKHNDDFEETIKQIQENRNAIVKLEEFEAKTNEEISSMSIQIRALLSKVRTEKISSV